MNLFFANGIIYGELFLTREIHFGNMSAMRRLFCCLFMPMIAMALQYEVRFIGLPDRAAVQALIDASQLVSLQSHPPASINGLRYRIASDIPSLIRVLHAYAYYEATITSDLVIEADDVRVDLLIHPGPQYALTSYEVFHGECTELLQIPQCCSGVNGQHWGVCRSSVHSPWKTS